MKAGEQREPAYLHINPMGKVPAIKHGEALITEQVAIFIISPISFRRPASHLPSATCFAGLIRAGSSLTAAPSSRPSSIKPCSASPEGLTMPYCDFDTMFAHADEAAGVVPGERFSGADLLWGSALTSMTGSSSSQSPVIAAYAAMPHKARPAYQRVTAKDAEIAATREVA